jgi:predicted MPP superfamily phosphohydrolase
VTDLHITAGQRRKHAWIRALADLQPDLVVNTGDTLSAADAIQAAMYSLEPLSAFPAVFVPGNNDYYAPRLRSPIKYFKPHDPNSEKHGPPLPWPQLASALTHAGWVDLTHHKAELKVAGRTVALAGTDDPHLRRANYDLIAGAAPAGADVRIGVTHSPEPFVQARFANDGYDLVLAGHTHGGQVRVPFGPAISSDLARRRCGSSVPASAISRPAALTVARTWVRSSQPACVKAEASCGQGSGGPCLSSLGSLGLKYLLGLRSRGA